MLPRSPTDIAKSIDDWVIVERDGGMVACSNLVLYEQNMAELACVVVCDNSKKTGTGDAMLGYQMRRAHNMGVQKLFVLSTVAMDWFKERGFTPATYDELPPSKKEKYDRKRGSKIMMKLLTDRRMIDEQELLLDVV